MLTWAVQVLMFIYNSSFTSPRKSQRQLAHTLEVRKLQELQGLEGFLNRRASQGGSEATLKDCSSSYEAPMILFHIEL